VTASVHETLLTGLGLSWDAERRVTTKRGERLVRNATPTPEFWNYRKIHADSLKQAGISVGKNSQNGQWQVAWWQEIPAEVRRQEQSTIEASRATSASIEVPAPSGFAYLPFQKAGIAFASKIFEGGDVQSPSGSGVLIGDEMGLGKTIQTIGVLNLLADIRHLLLIVPASLKLNWQRELGKWLTKTRTIGLADGKTYPDTDIVIVNYENLGKHRERLASTVFDLIVCDECQKIKNPKAQRTQAVLQLKAKRKLALTGTPILNRPIELYPILSFLNPKQWGSLIHPTQEDRSKFWRFAKRYCDAQRGAWGWDLSGASNLEELQVLLRRSLLIRRLKKDVLTELPPKIRQVIEVPCDEDTAPSVQAENEARTRNEARLIHLKAAVELAKASDDPEEYKQAVNALQEGVRAHFTELSRLRHETALAKVPIVIEHVENALEEGNKVVLFAHHKDVLESFHRHFASQSVLLTGDTAQSERQAAVDRFQTDPQCTLFVGSIQAAGVGLTLTSASHVIFAEQDWVPGNITQAEDRLHRIGQHDSVLVQHLVLERSLDATMARRIMEKQDVIDRALDIKIEQDGNQMLDPLDKPATATETAGNLQKEAALLTSDSIEAIHQALRILAGHCDGAVALDNTGFNKIDACIGHGLAEYPSLTPKQAALGKKIVLKYRRQLPEALLTIIRGVDC
jgi:superfamily II DNA or RNA helicase